MRIITKKHDWAAHFLEALKESKSVAYRFIINNLEPKLEKVGMYDRDRNTVSDCVRACGANIQGGKKSWMGGKPSGWALKAKSYVG